MKTERSSYLIADVSENMTSVRAQLLHSFQTSVEYRHAFVEEKIRSGLAAQIKAIREQRGESQTSFARMLNKSQSWVSRLEDPNAAIPIIPTLLIVARAFDVDLEVRFAPFSKLLDRLSTLTPESFEVPKFEDDCGLPSETTTEDTGIPLEALSARDGNRRLERAGSRQQEPKGNVVSIDEIRSELERRKDLALESMAPAQRLAVSQ